MLVESLFPGEEVFLLLSYVLGSAMFSSDTKFHLWHLHISNFKRQKQGESQVFLCSWVYFLKTVRASKAKEFYQLK
jgi:hypothetical protein